MNESIDRKITLKSVDLTYILQIQLIILITDQLDAFIKIIYFYLVFTN